MKQELIKAKALIKTPKKWIQGKGSQKNGKDCWDLEKANQFCAMGAVERIVGIERYRGFKNFMNPFFDKNVIVFNDNHTHAEVMEAFDKAIAAAY